VVVNILVEKDKEMEDKDMWVELEMVVDNTD
jgi:hypothetical protein